MKLYRKFVSAVCLAASVLSVNAQNSAVQEAIDKFVSAPSLRNGSVGVQVVSLDSMKVMGEFNPYQSEITASTMKTVTSATALHLLGNDFKFSTKVYATGKITKKGRIEGDLVVKGGGDPTLGSRHLPREVNFIDALVAELKARGIKEVKGNIVVDDSAIPEPNVPASWMIEDLGYGYGTSIHGLNFADNELKLNVTIDENGFNYYTDQTQSYLKVENRCNAIPAETDSLEFDGLGLRLDIENDVLHLNGNVKFPFKSRMTIANPSPDLLMRDSLEVALKAAGIKVKHKNVKAEKKVATSLVLDYKSLELSKIVESLLIRSDNMYTECVLRAIASNAGKQPTSSNGVAVVKNFWKEKGLDVEGLFMLDGSGLSRTNKAPVSFFTQMLALALPSLKERNVDFELLFPVAGKNGTVRRVAANTPAAGKFALKSGSMSHVQCYVGYYPVDAPKYAVAILINSFTCPRSELVKMVGEMLVGIDAGLSAE